MSLASTHPRSALVASPRAALLILLAGGAAAAIPAPAARAATESHSFIATSDRDAKPEKNRLYDFQVIKTIHDKLDGHYDDLQIVVSSCNSGGFASEAESRLADRKWSVTTSRDSKTVEKWVWGNNERQGGKTGFNYHGDRWMHGWQGQWAKKLFETSDATAEALFDFAKANDFHAGRTTSIIKDKNDGKNSKVFLGARSHAALWSSFHDDGGEGPSAMYKSLVNAGYADNTINFRYHLWDAGDTIGGVGDPPTPVRPVDGRATRDGFSASIDAIKTGITATGTASRKALVHISAHGNVEKIDPEKVIGALPNMPNQGRTFTPASATTTLALDDDFLGSLYTGVAPGADPTLIRSSKPMIRLSTVFEASASPVDVYLDDILVGAFNLSGSSAGGTYAVEIEDDDLLALHDSGSLLADMAATVRFSFPSGAFQVATDWDYNLGLSDAFGVGFAGPAIMSTPAPGALALFSLASIAAQRRRRA